MSRSKRDLAPVVRAAVDHLFQLWDQRMDTGLLLYQTYRSLAHQSRLYRQSRTTAQIEGKVESLTDRGFGLLADTLEEVGPQWGKLGAHVTWAGPGESWHNYRRAVDCVPLDEDGQPLWEQDHILWPVYGDLCAEVGLHWGGSWERFSDLPHAQLHEPANPLKVHTPDHIHQIADQLWRTPPRKGGDYHMVSSSVTTVGEATPR